MNGYRVLASALLLLAAGILPARANLVADPGFGESAARPTHHRL